jgi:hypothetical protein
MLAEKTRLESLCNRETRERKWADKKLPAFLHFFTRDESMKAKKKKTENGRKTSRIKNLLYSFSATKRGEMNKKGVYSLSKDCGVSALELAELRQLVNEVVPSPYLTHFPPLPPLEGQSTLNVCILPYPSFSFMFPNIALHYLFVSFSSCRTAHQSPALPAKHVQTFYTLFSLCILISSVRSFCFLNVSVTCAAFFVLSRQVCNDR